MEKFVIVFYFEGEWEDCKHEYIAIFPEDASADEITEAVGKHWEEVPVHSYASAQKRVFKPV